MVQLRQNGFVELEKQKCSKTYLIFLLSILFSQTCVKCTKESLRRIFILSHSFQLKKVVATVIIEETCPELYFIILKLSNSSAWCGLIRTFQLPYNCLVTLYAICGINTVPCIYNVRVGWFHCVVQLTGN